MSPPSPHPLSPAAELAGSSGLERDALSRLYESHARRVLKLAQRMTRDRSDAEDIVQDVFVDLCRRRASAEPERAFPAGWLTVVVRNRALDLLRKKRAIAAARLGASSQPAPECLTPEKELLTAQVLQQLRLALDRLPEQQRKTLELGFLEVLSQAEIAARCATPLGTVKARCRAAQARLGQLLK